MKHSETSHEMDEDDLIEHKEGLMSHMDEYGECMPEHHKTMIKGMCDECDDYRSHEGENDKEPEHPLEEPRTDAPEGIYEYMNKKHKDKMDKK